MAIEQEVDTIVGGVLLVVLSLLETVLVHVSPALHAVHKVAMLPHKLVVGELAPL